MENCIGIIMMIHIELAIVEKHTVCAENEPITLGYIRLENATKRQELYTNESRTKAYRAFR